MILVLPMYPNRNAYYEQVIRLLTLFIADADTTWLPHTLKVAWLCFLLASVKLLDYQLLIGEALFELLVTFAAQWTVPQLSIMIIYNGTWSILIE